MCRARSSNLLGIALIVIAGCSLSAEGKYGGGSGEPNDPYQIRDANHMHAIGADSNDWDKHFKLVADINLYSYNGKNGHPPFNLIGGEYVWNGHTYVGTGFSGTFDGNNYEISNFVCDNLGTHCVGLFRSIAGNSAEIKNLRLLDPNVTGGDRVGALVGIAAFNASISDCNVQGGNVTGDRFVGGIIGFCYEGTQTTYSHSSATVSGNEKVGGLVGIGSNNYIYDCYTSGVVLGGSYVGGLVGSDANPSSRIKTSYSSANVSATGNNVGGFIGSLTNEAQILNCYATGSVNGADYVGGFIGGKYGTTSTIISWCYATGAIMGTGTHVNGIAGTYTPDCSLGLRNFFDIETTGIISECGGKGKTTMQMRYKNTFTSAGWDFDTPIWVLPCNDYPRLWWENRPPVPQPTYSGGTGTEFDPYLISTAEELHSLVKYPCHFDRHFCLIADIDLSDYDGLDGNPLFNRIGVSYEPFTGVFDGNGHEILNFTYVSGKTDYLGVFGYVSGPAAEIKNLGLRDVNIDVSGSQYVGALVGYLNKGTVSNCYVEHGRVYNPSSALDPGQKTGGLIGTAKPDGTISNCYFNADVLSRQSTGGLAGVFYGDILNSWFMGSVTSIYYAGGLIGQGNGNILNSYSIGEITSGEGLGGIAGHFGGLVVSSFSVCDITGSGNYVGGLIGSFDSGSMTYCYSGGNISGNSRVGGLVGFCAWNPDFFHCYSSGEVNGVDVALTGGLIGMSFNDEPTAYTKLFWNNTTNPSLPGIGNRDIGDVVGISSVEMQTQSTFTDAGWDFVGETINGPNDIWRLCEDLVNYPRLAWEFPLGDFLCPDGVDFFDYSFFTSHWQEDNCGASNNCDGTDLNLLGKVEINDLRIFVNNWLKGF